MTALPGLEAIREGRAVQKPGSGEHHTYVSVCLPLSFRFQKKQKCISFLGRG